MNLAIGPVPGRRAASPAPPRVPERALLRLGIALTGLFLAASIVVGALPIGAYHGWTATHLALAGAATVAIGTFMPHFGSTLAGTRAEPWWLRLPGILALAVGMATVALGRPFVGPEVAAAGGGLVLAGIGFTAWATYGPMRFGLARRHPIVQLTYGVALLNLAVGASLAILMLLVWPPVAGSWVALKPAHAWLNVFGFVSLTVAGTLIYLYPTMLGARIRAHPSMALAIAGLVPGAPTAAIGYAVSAGPVALVGGVLTLGGALGLLWFGVDTWRRRGTWSSEHAWHDLAARHGLAAQAWFVAATATAVASVARDGVVVPGWTLGALAVPLIGGWVAQVLVAAWGYLLPAVGPGDPGSRSAQRRVLAAVATPRWVAWNAGLLLLWPGLAWLNWWLIVPGALLFGSAGVASLVLLGGALLVGRRPT